MDCNATDESMAIDENPLAGLWRKPGSTLTHYKEGIQTKRSLIMTIKINSTYTAIDAAIDNQDWNADAWREWEDDGNNYDAPLVTPDSYKMGKRKGAGRKANQPKGTTPVVMDAIDMGTVVLDYLRIDGIGAQNTVSTLYKKYRVETPNGGYKMDKAAMTESDAKAYADAIQARENFVTALQWIADNPDRVSPDIAEYIWQAVTFGESIENGYRTPGILEKILLGSMPRHKAKRIIDGQPLITGKYIVENMPQLQDRFTSDFAYYAFPVLLAFHLQGHDIFPYVQNEKGEWECNGMYTYKGQPAPCPPGAIPLISLLVGKAWAADTRKAGNRKDKHSPINREMTEGEKTALRESLRNDPDVAYGSIREYSPMGEYTHMAIGGEATIKKLFSVAELTKRERDVVRLHILQGLSQWDTAMEMGYSQYHVSRLSESAIIKLRKACKNVETHRKAGVNVDDFTMQIARAFDYLCAERGIESDVDYDYCKGSVPKTTPAPKTKATIKAEKEAVENTIVKEYLETVVKTTITNNPCPCGSGIDFQDCDC